MFHLRSPCFTTLTFACIRALLASSALTPEAFEKKLRQVQAPTLVVWGERDAWIPPAHADRLLARILGARKVMVPGAGHTPQEEKPDEVARLLRAFIL